MRILKVLILGFFVAGLSATITFRQSAQDRPESAVDRVRRDRFRITGPIDIEISDATDKVLQAGDPTTSDLTEAATGHDNLTNGYLVQGPPFDTIDEDNVVALASFNDNRFIFEEVEGVDDGLGPTYNAQSCRECHQNVVTGGSSQITEQRTGRTVNGEFFESLGGSLIHSRATDPRIVEMVADADNTRTFRASLSTLGDGYVEAIANQTLINIRDNQPSSMRGTAIAVPVLEANGIGRVGRFGWKGQHASLVSFSADAYLNEMGITTPTFPEENTSSGRFVGFGSVFDPVEDPEDDGVDVIAFADFMRSTKAPNRGPITTAVQAGDTLFRQIDCDVCHVTSITTAPAGTLINGGAFRVPPALGERVIHPFSDFLLHNIGTADGIPILPTAEFQSTANQVRTPPLWGLRTRNRLMHDGLSFTLNDAILRHSGQAVGPRLAFQQLTSTQKANLLAFLRSL